MPGLTTWDIGACCCEPPSSCTECLIPCGTCPAPAADLLLTGDPGGPLGMTYNGNPTIARWTSGLTGTSRYFTWDVGGINCPGILTQWIGTTAEDSWPGTHDGVIIHCTTNPYHVQIFELGTLIWTIDGPNSLDLTQPVMCAQVQVLACIGGYPGITVTITGAGGVTASSVTNGSGWAYLTWNGSPGTYTISIAGYDSRFNPSDKTLNLACNQTVFFGLGGSNLAEGYDCSLVCALPLADTLHGTMPGVGPVVFVYDPGSVQWNSITPAYPVYLDRFLQIMGVTAPTSVVCPPAFEAQYGPGNLVLTE